MGRIEQVSCSKCNASWQCNVGYGFQVYSPYQMACCRNCKAIISVQDSDENKADKDIFLCPECGEKVELIENIEDAECPVCRQKSLRSQDVGRWD